MPLIKDGEVSGVLPESECFAVHYPGYPSSVARAVETLGGFEEIAKKRINASGRADSRPENRNESRLELRFRPEDPYCHPAFGDLRSCRGLLLKICKKEKNREGEVSQQQQEQHQQEQQQHQHQQHHHHQQQQQQQSCSDDAGPQQCNVPGGNEESAQSVQLFASIVARVRRAYYFDGLADYQFVVPVHAARSRQKKRRRADVEPSFEDGGMDMEQDELIMLVPKLFSPKDMPDEILLRQSARGASNQQQQAFAEDSWEVNIAPCLRISFEIKKVPEKVHWEDNIPKDSHVWVSQMAVSKLFDERPIWPRWSLIERLDDDGVEVSYNQLRRLLIRSGYYFSTGPFGQFWIKKGYDPRTDPDSRIYQKVEFRLRDLLPSAGGLDLNIEYGMDDFGMTSLNKNNSSNRMHHELKQRWKYICCFQEFPLKACTLQLFELDDDYIQEKIRDSPRQTTCTHSTGWFSRTTFELLCLRVKIKFLSAFPKKGGKSLRSLHDRFEMLKKLEILDSLRGQSVEDLDVNKDTISLTSKDIRTKDSEMGPMNVDEGCAEHETNDDLEEDEEEEEELDEYESQPVGVEDGSFSASASSYLGHNVNLSYLQELLCSKIVEEGGDQPNVDDPHLEASDGEYQIYEQDSDGTDYFDEDDGA